MSEHCADCGNDMRGVAKTVARMRDDMACQILWGDLPGNGTVEAITAARNTLNRTNDAYDDNVIDSFLVDHPQETHYSRVITVERRGVYDGGLYFMCPDCGFKWHRWPEGHYLRARAEPYVREPRVVDGITLRRDMPSNSY
jgi:hypothetical protein